MPCRCRVLSPIHKCRAVPLPSSDIAVSLVKVRVWPEKIRTANRETPRNSRKEPNLGQTLIYTYHAVSLPCFAVDLRNRLQSGMVGARRGHGIVCVIQTRSHCVIQMRKTQSKSSATRHGRGTAWYGWISLYSPFGLGVTRLEWTRVLESYEYNKPSWFHKWWQISCHLQKR